MNKQDKDYKLDRLNLLMRGLMPATIVHFNRQPLPDSFEDLLTEISDREGADEKGDMLKLSARAFLDAEDDYSAAAAFTSLFVVTQNADDLTDGRLKQEIDHFIEKCRSAYLRELKEAAGTDRYDDMIAHRDFLERCASSGDMKQEILARYLYGLDMHEVAKDQGVGHMGNDIPEGSAHDDNKEFWLDLTKKKIKRQCEECLKSDTDLSREDREHIKGILEMM